MAAETIKRIDQLLKEEEEIPIRDAAGIITANGIDAAARIRAIKSCLRIIKEEGIKEVE